MNYLAHLYLARPTADSCFGNLLGDFRRGVDLDHYSEAVQAGVANHILVDKFTESHSAVRQARGVVSARRRRFAGIMLDVLFDHFLIKHWSLYSDESFTVFSQRTYECLAQRVGVMPERMQVMVRSMLTHRWLDTYRHLQGIEKALERTASRIRFQHSFHGSIDEVKENYAVFEETFLTFFPQLLAAVRRHAVEE